MANFVLVPAYGRDYKSKKDVNRSFAEGKDWQCQPQGSYVGLEELRRMGETTVQVRYGKLQKVAILDVGKGECK